MTHLSSHPKVVRLTRELGLVARGDYVTQICTYATNRVERVISESLIAIDSLDTLRWVVADKFRVRLEFLFEDVDVERIAQEYTDFHPTLRQRLAYEFIEGTTEGITLERDEYDPCQFRYLSVIDARGQRAARAYFTAWHELTHLVILPPQLVFNGFRRTPPATEIPKDPIEAVVDHVAGRLAFFPPYFHPALDKAVERCGGFTFSALEAARSAAAPSASLFATAIAGLAYAHRPTLLTAVGMALKADDRRAAYSPQQSFPFADRQVPEKLRVTTVVPNELALGGSLAIRRNMRVPTDSVLAAAYASMVDVELEADEDQSTWETSRSGALEALPIKVQAVRRGRFVYGLVAAAESRI
jgi:hypothetical protein